MVFELRDVHSGDTFLLGPNNTYTLGRSRRHHILLKTTKASLLHATITTSNTSATIEDNNSKLGTKINGRRINQPCELHDNDQLEFGAGTCKYVFLDLQFQAIQDKSVLLFSDSVIQDILNKTRIRITKQNSTNCSYYIVDWITLDTLRQTPFLYHLVKRNAIVKSTFLIDMANDIHKAPPMPNIYRYMPKIDNYLSRLGDIKDIDSRRKRNTIFTNKLFIFFNQEHFEHLLDVIELCGGKILLYQATEQQEKIFYQRLENYLQTVSIIIVNHREVGQQSEQILNFLETMKGKNIEMSEIAADDLYISIVKCELINMQTIDLSNTEDLSPSVLRSNWIERHKTTPKTTEDATNKRSILPKNGRLPVSEKASTSGSSISSNRVVRHEQLLMNPLSSKFCKKVPKRNGNGHTKVDGQRKKFKSVDIIPLA